MTRIDLTSALEQLPDRFRGPGGVAGVVKDGVVIERRAWGYKDLARHEPMTSGTLLPICSISKQFTCGVLLDRFSDFAPLERRLAELLPNFEGPLPSIAELAANQSGLRDYWALTILLGARAEQHFAREDAFKLFNAMRTGHFAPGTSYSYSNGNFRLLGELIERETGRNLEDLYKEIIWGPAGMTTARLTADTRTPADDVTGYEGNDLTGFFPSQNGIYWFGDAGISASLDDMLAYECWIDATRDDPQGTYRKLSAPPHFRDGSPAAYGNGLAHFEIGGIKLTGHAGALRGFRAQRMHAASERLSVVVIFNHEADTSAAAASLFKAVLGIQTPQPQPVATGWDGQWMCPETGLMTRLDTTPTGGTLRYATSAEAVAAAPDGTLKGGGLSLSRDGEMLVMARAGENLTSTLKPLPTGPITPGDQLAGRYHAEEFDSELIIEARDGGLCAGFEGALGKGIMERVHPVGPDVWVLATRRSMDAPAPGDWTLVATRGEDGKIAGLTLGCWLARRLSYQKAE